MRVNKYLPGNVNLGFTNMTVQENVKKLITKYPTLRENYNVLCFWYWTKIDGIPSITADSIQYATSAESITRAYREVSGLDSALKPTVATQKRRKRKEVQTREYYVTYQGNRAFVTYKN